MKLDRRTFLLAAGASYLGACSGDGAREVVAGAPPRPPLLPTEHSLSVFTLGDTGWVNDDKDAVARAMVEHAGLVQPDLAILLGDNFYLEGVKSTRDEMWRTHFEEPYAHEALRMPFYACLGNHDHNGNILAQVEYTQMSERWHMPAQYYTVTRDLGPDTQVEFFVTDAHPIRLQERTSRAQMRWLEDKLAESTARWKVAVGHLPLLSNGEKRGSSNLTRRFVPLFERYGVQLYMAGHSHDQQLLTSDGGWLQLIAGSGAGSQPVRRADNTLHASSATGFAHLRISPDEMHVQFVTADGGPGFTHRVREA